LRKVWYRASLGDRTNTEKFVNAPEKWDSAEKTILEICDELDLPHVVAPNEAAFYGPKIGVSSQRARARRDTAFTVQLDSSCQSVST